MSRIPAGEHGQPAWPQGPGRPVRARIAQSPRPINAGPSEPTPAPSTPRQDRPLCLTRLVGPKLDKTPDSTRLIDEFRDSTLW
jgi:hypothetical protein